VLIEINFMGDESRRGAVLGETPRCGSGADQRWGTKHGFTRKLRPVVALIRRLQADDARRSCFHPKTAVVGIISIGDVLKHRLDELELEANVMRDYAVAARH
jgi:hypothetical protein